MSEVKLTAKQKKVLERLRQYPDDIIMNDGYLTGGHGVRLDMRTVRALKEKGMIDSWGDRRNRISDLGKTIEL